MTVEVNVNNNVDQVYEGIVVWFNPKKGYGFVDCKSLEADIFCHFSNIEVDGFKTVRPGDKVRFKLGRNHKNIQAINIKVLSDA